MRYILMVLLAVFGPLCFGHFITVTVKEANVRVMKFLCDSGERVSLCESVQRFMEAKEQYNLVLTSEKRRELSERLKESYNSEVDPYLRNLCYVETPPNYMITVCEVLRILNKAEEKLWNEDSMRVPGSDARRIQQAVIKRTRHEVREEQKNYEVMRGIAMEFVCERKEGPKAFCDLLEEFKVHEEENLYRTSAELRDARTALKNHMIVMCEIEKEKKHSRLSPLYLKVLCGFHLHPHVPSSLLYPYPETS